MKKIALLFLCAYALNAAQFNAAMQEYIAELKSEALKLDPNFKDFDAAKGELIFVTKNIGKNSQNISCQSCHGEDLTKESMNIFTNKTIAPLSPNANSSRLSDVKEVKKWLKRNFKDVYLREGTAIEKGDVLYYLIKQ
ncbi:DUF1924 domain-containing protein [Campylobacter hyointestinalis]|uniref:Sphaeroides heme protein n=1 Tax=Campylobacter hyointestinalis subsp. hyointestinalis TaxID=91352 RepID=A0A2S5J345_CAMHY|nr:DUF1924 domain-containing protein [Campylobacter hyointestinalis]MDL2347672.1 DUF1924 domain-containing protein [Campylobacter hyointestinalis]MDL2349415.1 DUF1924 domain-containing protein [Campylobacter hyointestinalis]MDL2351162.1 DUF1924 domain-containing protein [Campylobacter hyointestinalis]MDM1026992.1 DUF1924 domain-containing protein [Campylobacter hyointestinalis]MDM1028746.1 DUF1924 domain-containing protein [Campylobacter hyointestinalis]